MLRKWKKGLALVAIIAHMLVANESANEPSTLNGVVGLLDGCIDPTTGSWIDREVDLKVPGTTLILQRSHSSTEPGYASMRSKVNDFKYAYQTPINLWARWGSNYSTLMCHKIHSKIMLQDTSGHTIDLLCGTGVRDANDVLCGNWAQSENWSNLYTIYEGAKCNPHNYTITHTHGKVCKVVGPQGIIRFFNGPRVFGSNNSILFESESERIYPSGIAWKFFYEQEVSDIAECRQLKKIEEQSRNQEKIAAVTFSQSGTRVERALLNF